MGILGVLLVGGFLAGNRIFAEQKELDVSQEKINKQPIKLVGDHKKYMYWNGEKYIGTDSSYISPEFEVIAMNKQKLLNFRRITRKDTLTEENALGKTWYSKYNGNVEFFTMDGVDPDTGKELDKSTSHMILKYRKKGTIEE
jgi:hypothetical protein